MRLVQDLIFLEQLDFAIPLIDAHRCQHTTKSWGAAAAMACELVGIELQDYHTAVFTPRVDGVGTAGVPISYKAWVDVSLRSKAWRERVERFGQYRPGPIYG